MVNTINIDDYVDLKNLIIDKTKPKQKRLEQFVSSVKNTDTVRVGDTLVRIEFAKGRSFLDALTAAFTI